MLKKNILLFMHNDATQFVDICNQYARIFDRDKYKITAVFLQGEFNQASHDRVLADEVIFLNFPKKSIRGFKIMPIIKMIKLCREKKFSLVICQRYKPSYIMLWTALFCRIPVICFVMHALKTLHSLPRKIIIAGLLRKNMILAGVSNAVRNDMQNDIRKTEVITLYNCIDIELTEPQLFLPRADGSRSAPRPA